MAKVSEIGRIVDRNNNCWDWIVSDGPFQYSGEIMLQSPFFNFGGSWKMTLHQSPDSQSILFTIANRVWANKSGRVFQVGLVDRDGQDITFGSGTTEKNGACLIRCNKSVAEFRSFVATSCVGRLIVFCKAVNPE